MEQSYRCVAEQHRRSTPCRSLAPRLTGRDTSSIDCGETCITKVTAGIRPKAHMGPPGAMRGHEARVKIALNLSDNISPDHLRLSVSLLAFPCSRIFDGTPKGLNRVYGGITDDLTWTPRPTLGPTKLTG